MSGTSVVAGMQQQLTELGLHARELIFTQEAMVLVYGLLAPRWK